MPSTTSSSRDTQLVDVLAIERGDERVLELLGDLLVDLVAPLLETLDVGHPLLEVVVLLDHLVQGRGGRREVLPVGDEQVEELGVLRQESKAHRDASRACTAVMVRPSGDGHCRPIAFRTAHAAAPMSPAAGMVRTQAIEDAPGDPPANVPDALAGADAHDRARDDLRGGDRHPEFGGDEEDRGRGRLGGEAVDRLQFRDSLAHRVHDPPAADGRAQGQRGRGHDDHPGRHHELRR